MNSNINLTFDNPAKDASSGSLNHDIFIQMDRLGINPGPLIETAAHDLLRQFGDKALNYAIIIALDFEDHGADNSALIWHKIIDYLECLNGDGALIAH